MRFYLSFLLVFLCVFATAQVPPMVIGGPQGIDVTRILARNWMSTPIYADTPSTPLTGAGWPGRGYLITVIKNESPCQNCPPKDTSLWVYTGSRWKRVGMDYVTRLVYGGQVSKASGSNLNYIIQPYGAFFDGDYRSSSTNKTATLSPKTINNTARIDVLVLNRDSFLVKTGIPKVIPQKPLVTGSEIEVASFYFQAFDSIPTMINTSAKVTNIYRVAGIDSIYFNMDTLTFAIKDSIGISKNDTASMLNPYKFTAANGLTKDSTVFRLGGSLNQNTNINLNTRRLTIIGGNDTTRFFSNGRVSIGGTPDSSSNFRVNGTTRLNGNTTYNGNLLPLPTESGSLYVAGFTRSSSPAEPARLQVYTNGGVTPIQYFELGSNEINHRQDVQIFFNKTFGYDLHAFGVKGIHTSVPGAGNTYSYVKVFPTIRVGPVTGNDTTFIRGFDFRPTLDSFNNVRIIPFTNTVGSNMFNTTWGNTRIGYPLSTLTSGNTTAYDTTFKLDVNGQGRFNNHVNITSGGYLKIPDNNKIQLGSGGPSQGYNTFITSVVPSNDGIGNTHIGYVDGYTGNSGNYNTIIGSINNRSNVTGNNNVIIGTNNRNYLTGTGTQNSSIIIGLGMYTPNVFNLNQVGYFGFDGDAIGDTLSSHLGFFSGAESRESNAIVFGRSGLFNATYNNIYFNGIRGFAGNSGNSITLNAASAGNATNRNGGNITIAGGRGTGNGTPGSVIFSTSTSLPNVADTATLQTLTERARISQRGNLLVGTSTDDTSSLVNIVSTTKGFLQPRMTNTQRDAITTPATGLQLFSTTDSSNYVYRGTGGGWQKIANEISGSATLNFPSTNGNTKSDLTINGVTGVSEGDVVALGVPNGSVLDHSCYTAWVSATDQITVRFSNYGTGTLDPASGTFKIKVFK